METVLVSLVSEQTVPNVLAVRHFRPDRLLFVSTPEMEKKGKVEATLKSLARAGLDYGKASETIETESDSILGIQRGLESWIAGQKDVEFIVNITCGTKPMSIAALAFFRNYANRIVYIPLRNEYLTIFPKKIGGEPDPIPVRLSVKEYVEAYGLRVANEKRLEGYKEDAAARREKARWIVEHYEEILNLLRWFSEKFRTARDEKSFELSAKYRSSTASDREFLRMFGFTYSNDVVTKRVTRSEMRFLTGGWLEEYCYNEIAAFVGCGIDDAEIGLKVKNPKGTDNEMDVMFTKDNALYFVECKSLEQKHDPKQNEALYKVGALQRDFGLRVESFLVTTAPDVMEEGGRIRNSVKARAKQFKTKIISPKEVRDFRSILADALGLSGEERR